jgi:feruloyl esterase
VSRNQFGAIVSAVASAFVLTTAAAAPGTPDQGPRRCDASLLTQAIPGATIVSATTVPAGALTPAFQQPALTVPALCQVVGFASPSADSRINFELWVPTSAWNGKLLVFGNGGYSSAIGYGEMLGAIRKGYAVLGGDTGHTGGDLRFAIDHPEKITDWGTRSVGEIAKAAKPVLAGLEGREPSRTYFSGCSTGGHQGYSAVQHYPDVFDGVVAGAPGNNRTRLNVAFLDRYRKNRAPGDDSGAVILPASKLPLVASAVVRACDATDGVTDGVVEDPRQCRFDTASLVCTGGGDESTCLTPAQKGVLDAFHRDIVNPRTGALIYPAFPLGSEGGFNQYWGTTEPTRADYWRHWVFRGAPFDWWTFDYDRQLAEADRVVGARVDQVNPDIGAFKARGGKLIVYQGWNDPVVNALDTIAYYESVKAKQGSQAAIDQFFRLFLVPGMGHCGGGTGTSSFDMVEALDTWVERGGTPESVPAARVVGGTVNRIRPICAYPTLARYMGTGSVDDAASFRCMAP